MDLMWFLLLAHLAGDYAFQSDRMAQQKKSSLSVLSWHVLIYTFTVGLTLWIYGRVTHLELIQRWWLGALLACLYVLHWLQDFLKGRHFTSRQAYYGDQLLHIMTLFVLRWLVV